MIDFDKYEFKIENWEFVQTLTAQATQNGNAYNSIPIQQSNLIYSDKLLLIYISHGGVQTTWNYGGRVEEIISTGLIVTDPINTVVERETLTAQKWNLFKASPLTADYTIQFVVPKWFTQWECTIFKYTGTITNQLNVQLEGIKSDIATLQSDFDAYFGI